MLHQRHDVRQIGLARILPVHNRSRARRHRGGGGTTKKACERGKLVVRVEEGRGEKRRSRRAERVERGRPPTL